MNAVYDSEWPHTREEKNLPSQPPLAESLPPQSLSQNCVSFDEAFIFYIKHLHLKFLLFQFGSAWLSHQMCKSSDRTGENLKQEKKKEIRNDGDASHNLMMMLASAF